MTIVRCGDSLLGKITSQATVIENAGAKAINFLSKNLICSDRHQQIG
jgi:hypothetical protein